MLLRRNPYRTFMRGLSSNDSLAAVGMQLIPKPLCLCLPTTSVGRRTLTEALGALRGHIVRRVRP